jgi:hypothetical protein
MVVLKRQLRPAMKGQLVLFFNPKVGSLPQIALPVHFEGINFEQL